MESSSTPLEELHGTVERITFHNSETGFTVARLQEASKKELTCIVGSMPWLQPGETVRCKGRWQNNATHGLQFLTESVSIEAPATLLGIERYLESGLIKGIGHTYAKRIVKRFGLATLTILDETPDRLLEIEGIGEKRLHRIKECWTQQKSIREVMVFLQSFAVSPA
jgi:exodeoxyribonuclease V alpha subunit